MSAASCVLDHCEPVTEWTTGAVVVLVVLAVALVRALHRGRVCPAGELVGDFHRLGRGGRFVRWDVLGDSRRRVRVCDQCARAVRVDR